MGFKQTKINQILLRYYVDQTSSKRPIPEGAISVIDIHTK